MLPVLQIGPFALQAYPLSLLLAAWAGLAVGARVATRLGIDGDHIYNAGFAALLAGLIFGRLGHVIAFWSAYSAQPLDIIGLNPRAFALWAALPAALAAAAWYSHRHHLPWVTVLDAAGPGLLAAAAVLDVGNLLAGQAAGAPTSLPWAINLWGVARHPSQVYELIAALVALAAAIWVLRHAYWPGRVIWTAILGYSLGRWLLEPFREASATLPGGFRTVQVLGLLAAGVALLALRALAAPHMQPQAEPAPNEG
jgi:phosphatidylglycerol---prolipoprotein diacylglyceryl transferase